MSKFKHGMGRTPYYFVWQSMRGRCNDPNMPTYQHYGGRGIKVCTRWDDFLTFMADMGDRPPGTSLDRIDNDGDYEPGNCRWATQAEQMRNRRTNKLLTIGAETKCLTDWCAEYGMDCMTVKQRMRKGAPPLEALTRTRYSRRAV